MQIDLERILEITQADEQIGVCLKCGNEQSAEPDTRRALCEACGKPAVFGAEEILLSSGL